MMGNVFDCIHMPKLWYMAKASFTFIYAIVAMKIALCFPFN